jgi:hypothetical protein
VDIAETLLPLKKWLAAVQQRHSQRVSANPLRVSFADLLDVAKKGRWWLIGSAWTGKQATEVTNEFFFFFFKFFFFVCGKFL